MTSEEKKNARMAMAKLDRAGSILRSAAGLASKAGAYDANEAILKSAWLVSRAMDAIDNAIRLPSKGSAEARTLPLFK